MEKEDREREMGKVREEARERGGKEEGRGGKGEGTGGLKRREDRG